MTAFAPGRLNLIGEHTDYNGGLALPVAITAGVRASALAVSGSRTIVADALDLGESDSFELDDRRPSEGWRTFLRGAVAELQADGYQLVGTRLTITGDVPSGSGLSSSAALAVALCLALVGAAGGVVEDRIALARLCSRVENRWVGARTGLLDQLASLCAQPEHALRIDFRTLELSAVRLRLDGYSLVCLDSGERHSIAGSGYNTRREECARAAELLGVQFLSDASLAGSAALPPPLDRRARHVLTENGRVDDAVAALRGGDMQALGALLDESHASLRDDFEVSTDAVEATVARMRSAGSLGTRLVGGGFGGSVLALMPGDLAIPEGAMTITPGAPARLL